jgi:hypothetical protein
MAAPPVQFQPTEILRVTLLAGTGQPTSWQLQPSNAAHAKLTAWLAASQTGWSNYLATTPGNGLLIDGQAGRLQFVGGSALACPKTSGCLRKSVQPGEYEYLLLSQPK